MLEIVESWPEKEGNFEAYATTSIKRAMTRSARILSYRLLESIEMFFITSYDHYDVPEIVDSICEHKGLTDRERDFIRRKVNDEQSFMSRSSEWRIKKSIFKKLREGELINA